MKQLLIRGDGTEALIYLTTPIVIAFVDCIYYVQKHVCIDSNNVTESWRN